MNVIVSRKNVLCGFMELEKAFENKPEPKQFTSYERRMIPSSVKLTQSLLIKRQEALDFRIEDVVSEFNIDIASYNFIVEIMNRRLGTDEPLMEKIKLQEE